MVVEKEILPLLEWLLPGLNAAGQLRLGALVGFLALVFGLAVLSLFIAFVVMAARLGPVEGFYAVAKAIATALSKDWPNTLPRRVAALARLSIQEALRRRVLVAFAVFALMLLFAGWFLDTESDHPAQLYLSFVLTAAERLVLILAVLLSTFSIPQDIRTRTIYTVVTKPVRTSEIVIGRMLGFIAVNTVILAMMAVVSYFFVVRGLDHRHTIDPRDVQSAGAAADGGAVSQGTTSRDAHHSHSLTVSPSGQGQTEIKMDHSHAVTSTGEGASARYEVGPPQGALSAKIPLYGKLRFLDREGNEGEGISVGKEWSYRQYIEGGSLAAAVWTFAGIRPEALPGDRPEDKRLPLEMNLSVFRTFKGDIVSGILGSITLRNPRTGMTSEPIPFTAREFVVYRHDVPRTLKSVDAEGQLRDIDLFNDLVDEGRLEVKIQCAEPAQYFGMAQADVYVRGPDGSFAWNFIKAYFGIWLQMAILTCFGVVFSTFLSGPVAMFASLVTYLVGLSKSFIIDVATGEQLGGGPLESLIRIVTQKNLTIELDMGPVVDMVVPAIDRVFLFFIWIAASVFPDYNQFNTSQFVAYGFNIDGNLLAQHALIALAFAVVLSVYGYFFLKAREIAG